MTKTHYSLITLAVILGGIAYFLPSEEPVLDDDLAVAAPGAVELVDQRSEFQKVYQLPNGSFQMVSYETPIHYLNNGQYVPIDPTFREENGQFIADKNTFTVSMPVDLTTGQELTVSKGNNKLTYKPAYIAWVDKTNPNDFQIIRSLQNVTGTLTSSTTIEYDEAFGVGTALQIVLTDTSVSKFIVIKQKPNITPRTANDVLVFLSEMGGNVSDYVLDNDNIWDKATYKEANNAVFQFNQADKFYIEQAIIEDLPHSSSSLPITNIKQLAVKYNNKLFLGKILPLSYLNNAEYPVRADSTSTIYPSNDTWIDGNGPTNNWDGRPEIRVGQQGCVSCARGILRFTMPSDPGGVVIDKIELFLKTESLSGGAHSNIDVYQGTTTGATSFLEAQATYNVYTTGNNWVAAGALSDYPSTYLIDTNTGVSADETYYSWVLYGAGASNNAGITWGEELSLLVHDPNGEAKQTDFHNVETAGTASDPYVVVTYSAAPAGGGGGKGHTIIFN